MTTRPDANSAGTYLDALTAATNRLDRAAINRFAELLFAAWEADRQVLVFGNGGSALTASHHVCDFVKTAAVDGQRRLRAISLVDNTGLLTAIANDIAYEDTFTYALKSYAKSGDLAVAISCSGTSPNVVRACQWAKDNKLAVVALTGFDGGTIKPLADVHINVPSENYGVIEDLHMSIGHAAAQGLKDRVSGDRVPSVRVLV